MSETSSKLLAAVAGLIAVLVLGALLLTKLGEMTLERATRIGVLEKTIEDASKDLDAALVDAAEVKDRLIELQKETDMQAEKVETTKESIDKLVDSITNADGTESKEKLDTVRLLIEELGESDSSSILLSLKNEATKPQPHYFSGSLASPLEWMAAAVAKEDYTGFCQSLQKEYVSHTRIKHNHYSNRKGNGYFYKDWYYVGSEFCSGDQLYWTNNSEKKDKDYQYAVRIYSGQCGCCIDTQHASWGMESAAIVWCQ